MNSTPDTQTNPCMVSVVIPVCNEEAVLPELIQRLTRVFDSSPEIAWRALLVNDGSRDGSARFIRDAAAKDARLELLDLSRNFGHQPALAAGMAAAAGSSAVVTMDADLQDPPEVIPMLVAQWREGAEVVLAVRRSRGERNSRRFAFNAFHRVFGRLVDFPIEPNTGTFGLLGGEALDAFNALEERHRFFPGLRSWIGFRRAEVHYDRMDRAAGVPQQTLHRLVRYALDGLFSFSKLPLRAVTYLGIIIAAFGFAVGAFFIVRRLLGVEIAFTGFTTLVVLLLFLGGVQLVSIGILGEYLGRVFDEVKGRPLYIVRRPAPAERAQEPESRSHD